MQFQSAQRSEYRPCVRRNLFLKTRLCSLVGNPQAPARIHIANIVPQSTQRSNQVSHALERLLKTTDIGNLRPDVNAHSSHFETWLKRGPSVERERLGNRHAELVLMQSSRNIGMSLR